MDVPISGTWASTGPAETGTFTGSRSLGFSAETVPGVYVILDDDLPGVAHVFTFTTGGTGVADWRDDPANENFNGSVNADYAIREAVIKD